MRTFSILILTILGVTVFGGAAWAIYSMADTTALVERHTIIAAATDCGHRGTSFKAFGVGFDSSEQTNKSCDEFEAARLMLLSGMENEARYSECTFEASLRKFASVYNCMNFETVGWEQIVKDVQAKNIACGGEIKWRHFKKRAKHERCMSRLA